MNALEENSLRIKTITDRVVAAQHGDRDALGELFVQFERSVYATALRRMKDGAEAEELVQEVFIRAMEKIGQLRAPRAFGGWLQSITNRMAINRLVRNKHARSAEPATIASTVSGELTPLDRALNRERVDQVRDSMGQLRELDRQTLQAFYMEGQSLLEMSDVFDAPVGTIKRRLHVARKRLAEEMADAVA